MATEKKMTMAQIKAAAKEKVFNALAQKYEELSGEVIGSNAYIPVTIGDQELWVEVKLTSKQYTDTKVSKAFDPFVAREAYEADLTIKRAEAAAKEKAKADKAKSKKSRGSKED